MTRGRDRLFFFCAGQPTAPTGRGSLPGVSRGPLREAIPRQEGRKLVERTPNIGVRHRYFLPQGSLRPPCGARGARGHGLRAHNRDVTDEKVADLDASSTGTARSGRSAPARATTKRPRTSISIPGLGSRRAATSACVPMLSGHLYDLLRVYRYKSSTLSRPRDPRPTRSTAQFLRPSRSGTELRGNPHAPAHLQRSSPRRGAAWEP